MIPLLFWTPKGTPTFVLGADVAVAWRVLIPGNSYSSGVLGRMNRSIVVVPGCWFLDVAERVRACVRKKQLTATEASKFFTDLQAFAIWVDDETPLRAWGEAFDLARTHRISVDNAAYLELALRTNLPLATTDATLLRVAQTASVPVFTP